MLLVMVIGASEVAYYDIRTFEGGWVEDAATAVS